MVIRSVQVKSLRPTQIAVGLRLVKAKRKGLRAEAKKPAELMQYILQHPIRVVEGPQDLLYVVDHHHLAHALLDEGFNTAPVEVIGDLSHVPARSFWGQMEKKGWAYPYDAKGRKQPIKAMPLKIRDMQDDPYRSLAGFVRRAGGFTKSLTPYVEFQWATYFRAHIPEKLAKKNFAKALKQAVVLASEAGAKDLPGYVRPKKSG